MAALIAVFIAFQAFVWIAWKRLVSARPIGLTTAERLLVVTVLYFAQIIGTSLLLGSGGALTTAAVVACNAVVSGLVALAARPTAAVPHAGFSSVPLLLGGGWLLVLNATLGAGLLLTAMLVFLHGAVAEPWSYDALKYHLPMVALMIQERGLAFPTVHNPVIASYPKNVELWFRWIVAFFGSDRWVDLGQVPFLFLAMVSTYCIARRLGSGRPASCAAALLLPYAPVVIAQLTTSYTDVAVSALVLAAIALLLIGAGRDAAPTHTAFGCAVGLLMGAKFSGLTLALPLLLPFAALRLYRTSRWKRSARQLGLVLILVLAFGSYAYARNWRLYSNPLYPYRTALGPWVFPGPWDDSRVYGVVQTRALSPLTRVLRSWEAIDVAGYSAILGGFGVTWPFLLVTCAVSLVACVVDRAGRRLAVFLLFVVLFAITPLNFRVRFVIYLLGLGCVSFAHLLERLPRLRPWLAAGALCAAAITFLQVWPQQYAALFSSAGRAALRDPCAHSAPPSYQNAYRWVRNSVPAGTTVLVFEGSGDFFPYCMWNREFSNRVEFARASSSAELASVVRGRLPAIVFLPHSAPAYGHYRSAPAAFRVLFADDAVSIVALESDRD